MTDLGSLNAPAKINLCLHVVGQRSDGYHLLDSLVAPIALHDTVSMRWGEHLNADQLVIDGGTIDGATEDNLVTKAISAVREHLAASNRALPYLSAELVKRLPVAAGLGGGSSDAVAALKLVARFAASQGHPISQDAMLDMALKLGADCPLFLMNGPVRMEGIGEQLSKLDGWSGLEVVLVNPNVPVSTPEIFRELQNKTQPAVADLPASWATTEDRLQWLAAHTRNDLQTPAIAMEPVITDVLAILDGAENCVLARMSGSGATCFGLFADHGAAAKAAVAIQAQRPQWWVAQSHTIGN